MKRETKKAPVRRRESGDRRREIVMAAAEFFASHGFDAGTRELAKHLGTTQPLLYRYFPTKEALIQEIYKTVYLELWDESWDEILLDPKLAVRDRLILFYEKYTAAIMNPRWLRLYLFAGLKGAEINQHYVKLVEERIVKRIIIEIWKEAGRDRPPQIDNRDIEMAWMLQGGIFYYGIREYVFMLPTLVSRSEMIVNAVDVFINGYRSILDQPQRG